MLVQAVVEKKGAAAISCEPGLWMKDAEYIAVGYSVGASRRGSNYILDYMSTMGPSFNLADEFRQGVMNFSFAIGKRNYEQVAKFRLDCGNSITSWVSVEFPKKIECYSKCETSDVQSFSPGSVDEPTPSPPNIVPQIAKLPPDTGQPNEPPPAFKRQLIDFKTLEHAGTVIVDTPHSYLYLVLGNGKALRYGIAVPPPRYQWSGIGEISRMKEWADWFPSKELLKERPFLPKMMAGGPGTRTRRSIVEGPLQSYRRSW